MNCPICDKAGLSEDAQTCTQCDSDLTVFLLLNQMEISANILRNSQKKATEQLQKSLTIKRSIIAVSLLVGLLLTSYGFWFYSEKTTEYRQMMSLVQTEKDSLQKVVFENQALIHHINTQKQKLEKQKTNIKYVVRKWDNLIKISRFFYGNDNQYLEIMKDNNLQEGNFTLFVGDTLTIKLKQ